MTNVALKKIHLNVKLTAILSKHTLNFLLPFIKINKTLRTKTLILEKL